MVDTQIVIGTWPGEGPRTAKRTVVWINVDVAYLFYATANEGLYQTKTTDGGATWATAVLVMDGEFNGGIWDIAVWHDRWTPGDTGTIIHCAMATLRAANNNSYFYYCQLDTSDDSSTEEILVESHGVVLGARKVGITKAVDGTLYVLGGVSSNNTIFRKSTNNGVNWLSSVTDPISLHTSSAFLMTPAPWADDDGDFAIIWIDRNSDKWQLAVYDVSADSTSNVDIFSMSGGDGNFEYFAGPSVAIRHSDNHIIFTAIDFWQSATTDVRIFDITDPSTITELTEVISDTSVVVGLSVLAAPNDDLYVAYGKSITYSSSIPIFYKRSTDGGTTWGAETAYSVDVNSYVNHDSPVSMQNGGMWAPIIFELDDDERYINVDNAVKIAGQEKDRDTPPGDTDVGSDGGGFGGGKPGEGSTSNPKGEGVGLLQPAMFLGDPPSSTVGLSGFEQLTHNLLVTDGFQGDLDDLAEHNEVDIKSG